MKRKAESLGYKARRENLTKFDRFNKKSDFAILADEIINPTYPIPKPKQRLHYEMGADVHPCTYGCKEHVFLGEIRLPIETGFKPGTRVKITVEELREGEDI